MTQGPPCHLRPINRRSMTAATNSNVMKMRPGKPEFGRVGRPHSSRYSLQGNDPTFVWNDDVEASIEEESLAYPPTDSRHFRRCAPDGEREAESGTLGEQSLHHHSAIAESGEINRTKVISGTGKADRRRHPRDVVPP